MGYTKRGERFYVEDGWSGPHAWYMPVETVGAARDNYVICCTDVILRNRSGDILLASRCVEPAKREFWFIGGRQHPGETRAEAAERHLRTDTGLCVSATRFHYVGDYETVFARREEPFTSNGTHTTNYVFFVILTDEEATQIRLSRNEYEPDGGRWFTSVEELKQANGGQICRYVSDAIRDMKRVVRIMEQDPQTLLG